MSKPQASISRSFLNLSSPATNHMFHHSSSRLPHQLRQQPTPIAISILSHTVLERYIRPPSLAYSFIGCRVDTEPMESGSYTVVTSTIHNKARWPSGLRRQLKVLPIRWSERAWVQIPLSSISFCLFAPYDYYKATECESKREWSFQSLRLGFVDDISFSL